MVVPFENRANDRFQPLPFLILPHRFRPRAGGAGPDVHYVDILVQDGHIVAAGPEKGVRCGIYYAHYFNPVCHLWQKYQKNAYFRAAMLFVLEGLDGAGKSTQVKKLKDYLESIYKDLEYIHFPRYDAPVYGNLIGKFLRGAFGPIETVHPQLVALLFAEDRHGAGAQIRQHLGNGGAVLLDRYVYSNIAYQCAKLQDKAEAEELRQWIFDTEYGEFKLPKPDLNIFLDVPIDFVENSLTHPREEEGREYLEGGKDIHCILYGIWRCELQ